MKEQEFPIFKTKMEGVTSSFELNDPADRAKYFAAKAGPELRKIRAYLEQNTFVAFLIGPKNSGKGTYSKLFKEAVGREKVRHISIGDIVRDVHAGLSDKAKKKNLFTFLEKNYRGFTPLHEAIDAILSRSTTALLPDELILALAEWEISRTPRKALFIDGFPRNMNQVSSALYFSALMGYRKDPDLFVFIDVPESVIDERIKYRVVCPKCNTPRNTRLLCTKEVVFEDGRYQLVCDDPACEGTRLIAKEGDELGIEAIRDRIEADKAVMRTLFKLNGVPKICLRNSIPVDRAEEFVDDYEITPSYRYETAPDGRVKVIEERWTVEDENGVKSYSLLPSPIVLSLIKQMTAALGLV